MSVLSNLLSANTSGIETDTSGWTAGANTSLAKSTRFYQGSSSLQLTATAAGTVTATTATRVAVTPGTVYQAYAFFANVVAASGRTSSVKINWYAGAVGGSVLSTSTGTATTMANATAFNTPPPQLIATAPAGATYATMTITVTGLTAGAQVVADLMVFGEPNAYAGNLISYADASVEGDTSGWDPSNNVTLTRTQPTAWEGWYSLTLTSVAAGVMQASLLNRVPCTAGTEYVGHVQVRPGATSDFAIQLNFYNSAGGLIVATSQTWPALPANTWTRASIIAVAPAGTASFRLALKPTATAAGQTWLCDQMTVKPAPLLTGSVLGYGAQSVEVNASAWSAVSGCSVARSTSRAWEGVASLAVTTDGSGSAVVRLNGAFPVIPGKAYKIAPYLYHGLKSATLVVDFQFRWLTSTGTAIETNTFHWQTASAAGWYTPTGSGVAPPGATSVEVSIALVDPGTDVYYIDSVYFGPGGIGIVATPIEGAYGAQISMEGLTTGGHTYWGLWRVDASGALVAVRGESGDLDAVPITSDLAVAQDYEAALGVSYRYLLRLHSATTWIRSVSRAITLPEPPSTDVVIKDPGQPARQAVLAVQTLPNWSSSARQGVNAIRGRRTPIVISDVRTSRTGTLTLITRDVGELRGLRWVLETGNTLLLQWPSGWEESDVYVQVGDVEESHIVPDATAIERTWSLPLTEVDRPIGGMTGSAARTWADVLAGSDDWLAVYTSAANWLGVYSGTVSL
jgi:hypothetical protein